MTRQLSLVAAAGAAVALLAGCGGGTTGQGAAQLNQGDRAMLQFAHCMRAHGVNMQDPFHRPGHAGLSIDVPTPAPATRSANGACGHFLQPIIEMKMAHRPAIPASTRLALVHYAECMRTRGVPMLDPDTFGSLNLGNVPGIANGPGRYTAAFHQDDAICRHLLPASLHDNGTGP